MNKHTTIPKQDAGEFGELVAIITYGEDIDYKRGYQYEYIFTNEVVKLTIVERAAFPNTIKNQVLHKSDLFVNIDAVQKYVYEHIQHPPIETLYVNEDFIDSSQIVVNTI